MTTIPVKSSITTEKVARYVIEKIHPDTEIELGLRLQTLKLPQYGMISSSDVGNFLSTLVLTANTKKAIEVGTFTGYTALKIASALPSGGKLICCDISQEWAAIGRPYWEKAGVASKIDLRIAPAMDTMMTLTSEAGSFDFAFIDADKSNYPNYYEACLQLLRPGGLMVLDNMLWDGAVADESVTDETTVTLRNLNSKIKNDTRVNCSLLTVGDGLMLVRKK
ncbi:MAG: SAM-dependent methyltransferase [Pseudobdellovibrio sp.]|jgi:predicted O-methyltransferase YrrM|nr:SAM-dependent methyltransferase [Pseudobdellovibrio sp.]